MIEETKAEIIWPDQWPLALGYTPWVEEVWANYISNALKYGGRPPRIVLGGEIMPDNQAMIRFWVRDNGPGLTSTQQENLFKPFNRFHTGQTSGHGLGLSIVKRIVETLGGPMALTDCIENNTICSRSNLCATQVIWKMMATEINSILESKTLQDLADLQLSFADSI